MQRPWLVVPLGLTTLLAASMAAQTQQMPKKYQEVLNELGRKGDYSGGVLKVNIPRNDLQVRVAGMAAPTPFGFGGWVAMTQGTGGQEVMMGDLVLLEDEVNPVMSALLENGVEVTALHNHFFWEDPRIFYMHIHGHGPAPQLARQLKPALDLIGRTSSAQPSLADAQTGLDTAKITRIVGHTGEQSGPVYKITIGRDDLAVKEMGATVNARMGLNTWAAFTGSDANAAIAGDVAMLENELTPVLKALRRNGIEVVAIHHHMIRVRPVIIFLHYWGRGPSEKLATAFRAALDEIPKARAQAKPRHEQD